MKKVITRNLLAVFLSARRSFKGVVSTLVILSTFPLGASALSPGDLVSFKRDVLTLEEMLDEVSSQLKCDVFYSEDTSSMAIARFACPGGGCPSTSCCAWRYPRNTLTR